MLPRPNLLPSSPLSSEEFFAYTRLGSILDAVGVSLALSLSLSLSLTYTRTLSPSLPPSLALTHYAVMLVRAGYPVEQ